MVVQLSKSSSPHETFYTVLGYTTYQYPPDDALLRLLLTNTLTTTLVESASLPSVRSSPPGTGKKKERSPYIYGVEFRSLHFNPLTFPRENSGLAPKPLKV